MTVGEICALITTVVGVIPTLVSVIVLICNIIKNKNWKLATAIADAAMRNVEEYSREHPSMTSDEKLEMALSAIEAGLKAANIRVDRELLNRLADYIKQSIDWFNSMRQLAFKILLTSKDPAGSFLLISNSCKFYVCHLFYNDIAEVENEFTYISY